MKIVYFFLAIIFSSLVFFASAKLIDLFFVKEISEKKTVLKEEEIRKKESTAVVVGKKYFVSLSGNDSNDGLSAEKALLTIQKAVDKLEPGDSLFLADGIYFQDFITRKNGLENAEIIISGSEKAIIKGTGKIGRIIEINHSFNVLQGFTVDGLVGDSKEEKNYRDKLIYIQGKEPKKGVTGVKILNMHLKNAGGECVRIKYFSQKNEIAYNKINGCGAFDFIFSGGGKNGEGIYIGTAPEQTDDDKNPTSDVDHSDNNWIHDNVIDTQGNECVDIKEGSSGNLVENNRCTGQKDKDSAGFDSRGSGNIFLKNESFGNLGSGIRLGGDKKTDGIDNIIKDNYLHDNQNGGIKIQRLPQKQICQNRILKNKKGDFVGEYANEVKNQKVCEE